MSEDTAPASDNGAQMAEETGQQANPVQKQEPGNVPYERFAQVNAARKAAESALEAFAAELAQDVPEEFRDLIPALPPVEKAQWIRAARARGLFSMPGAAPASSPDARRPSGKPSVDLSGMSAMQKIRGGYQK